MQVNNRLEKIGMAFKEAGSFIYHTPLWMVASLVAGLAFLILFPPFAAVFLSFFGASFLARLAVKIIEGYNPEKLKLLNEKILDFHDRYHYLSYLVAAAAFAAAIFSPVAGAVIAGGLGIYGGIIAEFIILKYQQNIRKIELDYPKLEVGASVVEN